MAARAAREATGRVLDPLHRHALPAGGRRGDGLLGQLGGVAAERQRATRRSTSSATWCSALLGLVVLHVASRHGPEGDPGAHAAAARSARSSLTVAVMLPGVGVTVNGATRWLGAGPLQFQPSELLKVALVLYAAQLLAARPRATKTLGGLVKPLLLVVGAACALLLKQPDMGTAMVICFAIGALLVAAGTPIRLPGRDLRRRWPALAFLLGAGRALPARAPDLVPRPVLGRRRQRLPGGAGAHRDRLGRLLRRRPRRVGAEDLLPARGPHGHDPGDHRRGARAWSGSSA